MCTNPSSFIPPTHPHCPHYCNTVARLLSSIRLPLRTLVCMLYTIQYCRVKAKLRLQCTISCIYYKNFRSTDTHNKHAHRQHARARAHTHTHTHAHTHDTHDTYTRHTHTDTHRHTRTYTHKPTHTNTHARTHTHTRTLKNVFSAESPLLEVFFLVCALPPRS